MKNKLYNCEKTPAGWTVTADYEAVIDDVRHGVALLNHNFRNTTEMDDDNDRHMPQISWDDSVDKMLLTHAVRHKAAAVMRKLSAWLATDASGPTETGFRYVLRGNMSDIAGVAGESIGRILAMELMADKLQNADGADSSPLCTACRNCREWSQTLLNGLKEMFSLSENII